MLDGVVDDSVSVIAEHRDDLPVHVVRLEENRGRPAALNAGFAAARGDVLIRCDDDLEPDPHFVADHVAAHGGAEPVGVVGLYRNRFPPTPYAKVYGEPYDVRFRTEAYAVPAAERWRYWAGNCSVTSEMFAAVGGYDEDFREYGWEDIDWGYRLAQLGVPVVLDPRLETVHHAANVDVAIRSRRAFLSGRARVRFAVKHGVTSERPAPTSPTARVWSFALDRLARGASIDRVTERGRSLDRALGVLPRRLGTRAVALLVESAALAGQRSVAVPR